MHPLMIAVSCCFLAIYLDKNMPKLLVLIAISLWGFLIFWILYKGQFLNKRIMDILDKYTDKEKLLLALKEEKNDKVIDPNSMFKFITQRVVGQDQVIRMICNGIYRRSAQKRKNKPVFSTLISGPTGTGKTEIAKAVSEFLFGNESSIFRVDCGSIASHGVSSLIGSPKGYVGSNEWGALTKAVRTNPNLVILFDEIEKAGSNQETPLFKILLSLIDEARITEQSTQKTIDASNCIIIMTSNANSEELAEIANLYKDNDEELIRASKDSLQNIFYPELLARIDLVTSVAPISLVDKARICIIHIQKICNSYGLNLEKIDHNLLVKAIEKSKIIANYGIRELVRWLENKISDELITAKNKGALEVAINFDNDKIDIEIKEYAK